LIVSLLGNHLSNIAKTLSKLAIEDFAFTHAANNQYGALVVFPFKRQFYLCEFAQADFQPELKTENLWYTSLGSTQQITDSFLALLREILWPSGPPPLSDGVFSAIWILDHAIEVNPGGVKGPVRIALCSNIDTKIELLPDLSEHRMNIKSAKDILRKRCAELLHPQDQQVPDVPHPN